MKEKIEELQNQIDKIIKERQSVFKEKMLEFLTENQKSIDSISVRINNHEFNDGDATYFGFYHEEPTIHYSDELGNEYEFDGYGKTPENIKEVYKKVLVLFSSFDAGDFYETMFGDAFERVTFKLENGKLEIG